MAESAYEYHQLRLTFSLMRSPHNSVPRRLTTKPIEMPGEIVLHRSLIPVCLQGIDWPKTEASPAALFELMQLRGKIALVLNHAAIHSTKGLG